LYVSPAADCVISEILSLTDSQLELCFMPERNSQFDPEPFLNNLAHCPGVYRMIGDQEELLYVGKARDLKKRVSSYFRQSGLGHRTAVIMNQTKQIEVTVTNTEAEALLLENNLIKQHRPRYNVSLRDDKSYPYIYVSTEQAFPRLAFHRGARRGKGRYFGPYANAGAVRQTLNLLQKLFRVRQCDDSFFKSRTRPCLQFQIKRCTAPCVGLIEASEYQSDVEHAIQFLVGNSNKVIEALISSMENASKRLEFEQAAQFRDQIEAIRRVCERQYVSGERGDLDIVACAQRQGVVCVQVFNIRSGVNLGNKGFFPMVPGQLEEEALITAFLGQYYLDRLIPEQIIVSHTPAEKALLEEMLANKSGHHVTISYTVRGERARWLELANRNAQHMLSARIAIIGSQLKRFEALQETLDLEAIPNRMECFDISHTMGESTVASCVVFDQQGPVKSDYRRFNIEGIQAGDDYAALRQALTRRFKRVQQGEGRFPDILFIDGGKGQLKQAIEVLAELQIAGLIVVGVAKGPDRRPGQETLVLNEIPTPLNLPSDSPALHLIQQLRDEAHRFAITGHRQRRAKARTHSPLEQIPGLGPKRRQSLLKHFGGLRGVSRAGIEELATVPGISSRLAQDIYDVFHTGPD
jgi:excinuclease ABC subunit C